MPTSRPTTFNDAGFTLIEIIVVVALIALITVIALPNISAVFKVSLKSSAREVANLTKEAYNAAVITGRVHRVVYDLGEQQYWVESGPAGLMLDTVESKEAEERRKKFKQEDEKHTSPFGIDKTISRKKRTLPRGVEFEDVETEQSKEPIAEGLAYTHFFPHGISEQTLIHLKDTSNHRITLHVAPILGRTRFIDGHVTLKQALEEK